MNAAFELNSLSSKSSIEFFIWAMLFLIVKFFLDICFLKKKKNLILFLRWSILFLIKILHLLLFISSVFLVLSFFLFVLFHLLIRNSLNKSPLVDC